MTISFSQINPNALVPLFRAEFDPSMAAGGSSGTHQNLLVGQMLAAGTATVHQLYRVYSEQQAAGLFGAGSTLHLQVRSFLRQYSLAQLWCIALADPAGVAATGSAVISGPATDNGVLSLLINGEYVNTPVYSGDSATDIGDALVALITANTNLPVSASNALGTVTITAKHVGLVGNEITMILNYREELGAEVLPAGVGCVLTQLSGGTLYPTLTTALAALEEEPFEWMSHPFIDTTGLDAFETLHDHTTGRWAPERLLFGHAFAAMDDTVSNLQTAGLLRNDPHHSITALTNYPQTSYEVAAAFHGQAAKALEIDPARGLKTLELIGILPPKSRADWHTVAERETLLDSGLATVVVSGGRVLIEAPFTTWQTDAASNPSRAYQKVQYPATLAEIVRVIRAKVQEIWARRPKLVANGTRYDAGQAAITPADVEAELVGLYTELEGRALVEDAEAFLDALVVERPTENSIAVLFPPNLANQFDHFWLLNQWRL